MTDIPFLFDPGPVAALQRLLGLGWPGPWRLITLLGSNWGILLVLGMALWLWGRRTAYSLLAVVAVDGLLKTALNSLFAVPRPDAGGIVKYERVEVGSFPSGHVSTAAGLWGWLALKGRVSWLLALIVVLLESISRLYLGVHFVGDIFGGILLAAVTISLVHWIWPHVQEWLSRRSFSFFAVVASLALAGVAAGTFFLFGDSPYKWRAGGLVAGLAIGLPLEYRFVRYHPGRMSLVRKFAKVAIGGAGIAAIGSTGTGPAERRPEHDLHVVGVGSHYMELDDPTTALAGVPAGAARIAVMHNPQSFPKFPAGTAPLAVAGHTHGGQVRLPFTPQWSWLTFTAEEEVHADGWVESGFGEAGNRLYVTRGLGMSLIPMRVNCPPELTYFILAAGR